MVRAVDSGSSGPRRENCVVFLSETLYSHLVPFSSQVKYTRSATLAPELIDLAKPKSGAPDCNAAQHNAVSEKQKT